MDCVEIERGEPVADQPKLRLVVIHKTEFTVRRKHIVPNRDTDTEIVRRLLGWTVMRRPA